MQLRDMARKCGPDAKLPTVRDMCRDFEVSSATLNDALRELVEQGVVTRRQGSGVYVSPNIHQKTIALVFGSDVFGAGGSPFYSILVRLCEKRVKSHGEKFSLFMDLPDLDRDGGLPVHRDLAEAVQSGKVHGILLAVRGSESQESWLRSQGLPTVSMAIRPAYGELVIVDYDAMVEMGVEALWEQGCRRIALISPFDTAEGRYPWEKDVELFRVAMQKHQLTVRPDWIVKRGADPTDYISGIESGSRAIRRLYGSGKTDTPDGLLVLDDMLARGALNAAEQLKIPIGSEIKMATHANKGSTILERDYERLLLLEIDPSEVAQAMLDLLERLMAGRDCPEKIVWIKPHLREPVPSCALT